MVMVALTLRIIALFLVMMMVVFVFMLQFFHLCTQSIGLHSLPDLGSIEFRPGRGDQSGFRIHRLEQFGCFHCFLFADGVGTAHNNEIRTLNLIIEKLAEIAGIHLCLSGIHHRYLRSNLRVLYSCYSCSYV